MMKYKFYWEHTDEGGARLLRVFGTEPQIMLPEQIEGAALTEIGAYCFARTSRLPEQYEVSFYPPKEEEAAMTELSGDFLVRANLPDTVQKIGNLAFYNCTKLEELVLGRGMHMLGSDAFMNCGRLLHITIRCGICERSGVRRIISQITSDLEVTFEKEGHVDAVIFYPEYYEKVDEVAPAHLFSRSIEGVGFYARECIRDGVIDPAQYDGIFRKACEGETGKTLRKIVLARLHYPVKMTEESRRIYEDYVREHATEFVGWLVSRRDLPGLQFFCEKGLLTKAALMHGVKAAAETEWAEGAAGLMQMKRVHFEGTGDDRYSFDD